MRILMETPALGKLWIYTLLKSNLDTHYRRRCVLFVLLTRPIKFSKWQALDHCWIAQAIANPDRLRPQVMVLL